MAEAVDNYVAQIQRNLQAGNATEHTHRAALQALLEALRAGLQVTNEPKHRTDCGAPDMVVMQARGFVVLGHIEAKNVGVSLAETQKTEQLKRYRKYLPNLILTDYVEFRWYVDGEPRRSTSLGSATARSGQVKSTPTQRETLVELLTQFLAQTPQPINKPRALAERLARLTHMIRDIVIEAFKRGKASTILVDLRHVLADTLIPNLIEEEQTPQFADLYAQTLGYGLFAARCHQTHTGRGRFNLTEAAREIPRTNPLLRQLFSAITGPDFDDEPYAGFVRELVAVLDHTAIEEILEHFGRSAVRQDPVLHFYETFLATYDPRLRESRGVYYTPEPVVSYIVRSVDHLLKDRFKIKDGLADANTLPNRTDDSGKAIHRTLILDPAAGTGTFLYEVVQTIREHFKSQRRAGFWNDYVHDHLLPRLFGFELLMAPYAVAHLKLAMQLAAQDMPEKSRNLWSYGFATDDRLQVYLTNTLEQVERHAQMALGSLQRAIAEEAKQAARVKRDLPILVVLGNPPYKGISSNTGAWIDGLLKGSIPDGTGATITSASYYAVDGKPIKERNPKWLQDDYVKFIRWAQWRLEQTGHGILAFITNHGYLDNPTFRGMRWALMEAFDEIYILDLHGNSKKKEVAPDGSRDDNVFDVRQGVAIGIFVKQGRKKDKGKLATVHHAELWGRRVDKYEWLADQSVESTKWESVEPAGPLSLFKPFDRSEIGDYNNWNAIIDVMAVNSVGIVTSRDSFVIDFDRTTLRDRIYEFAHGDASEDTIRDRYLRAQDKIDVCTARSALAAESELARLIHPILYRPFDSRWLCYHDAVIERSRRETMPHMFAGYNLALISARSNKFPEPNHFFASKTIVETKCGEASTQSCTFPLYLYPGIGKSDPNARDDWPPGIDGRRANLDPDFVHGLEDEVGMAFISDGRGDLDATFGPEDVLAYIYAVFHWPEYRRRYAPMLKLDFPRVPPPGDKHRFVEFVRLGHELLAAHLLEDESITGASIGYPVKGDNRVEKGYPKFVPPGAAVVKAGKTKLRPDDNKGRVYISPVQFFEGVEPAVWEFQIGGYQVCAKWLKDRRGRMLSYDDLTHYTRIVESLRKTIVLMARIQSTAETQG